MKASICQLLIRYPKHDIMTGNWRECVSLKQWYRRGCERSVCMYRMQHLRSGNDGYMMDGKRVKSTWIKEVFISR